MNFFHSIILGIVEGITEYLPISSTGHLILTSSLLNIEGEAIKTFEVVIQFGAILAVVGLYKNYVIKMFKGLIGKDKEGLQLVLNLLAAFLPAALLGFLFHKKIKTVLFYPYPVAAALFFGGIIMIISDYFYKNDKESKTSINELSIKHTLIIGIAQCFALFPGFSRSMATILGGLIVGLNRRQAAEFSFLLALPTLGMACLFDLYKGGTSFVYDIGILNLFTGLFVSGIVAALSIKWLISWLTRHGLSSFGWYRLILAVAVIYIWKVN